jgi:sigma-E factor negative regulatory protein RseC
MIETGVVIKKDNKGIFVRMQPARECANCSACFLDENKSQIVQIQQNLEVKPGELVEIEVKPGFTLKSAFLLFILPILTLVAGYFLAEEWFVLPGLTSEYQGLLGGFVALIFTYVAIYFYDKHLQKLNIERQIRIVRKKN